MELERILAMGDNEKDTLSMIICNHIDYFIGKLDVAGVSLKQLDKLTDDLLKWAEWRQKTAITHAGPCFARMMGPSAILRDGTKVKIIRGEDAHNAHVWLSVEPLAQIRTMDAAQPAAPVAAPEETR